MGPPPRKVLARCRWFREWADIEAEATVLRWYERLVVPGLLQTEDYARAILSARPDGNLDDLDEQVAARLARQARVSQVQVPHKPQIPGWQATRLNARYHPALRLAELVLRATSVEHDSGTVAVNGFLLDMPRLFEDFVTVALREALVSAYGGRVDDQDQNYFDEAGQVRLRPDIVWKIRGSAVAVIDAKYKAEKPAGYPNADLYQLLAYCTVLGLCNGHLVYAQGKSSPPSRGAPFRHRDFVPCR